MVGKLIKHELFSTIRIAAIPAVVMLLLAILTRITVETSNVSLAITSVSFYMFSVAATLFIGYFFGIHSFYQSLFTSNGYLTLSLPVTPDQLIWSKLIAAITVMFASIIICILSACIFFIGLPEEVIQQITDAFAQMGDSINRFINAEPMVFVELILFAIVYVPMMFLVFYTVMCIGQLFTVKNRKAIAILIYVGIVFVWSVFNQAIFTHINSSMAEVSIHLAMWVNIVFYAAVSVGCYFFVRYVIKNKVNLLA